MKYIISTIIFILSFIIGFTLFASDFIGGMIKGNKPATQQTAVSLTVMPWIKYRYATSTNTMIISTNTKDVIVNNKYCE